MARALPFATDIDEALKKLGRPRTWLAREAGIPYSTLVDHLRRDYPKISISNLFAIVEVLQLDITDFVEIPENVRRKHITCAKLKRGDTETVFTAFLSLLRIPSALPFWKLR